MSYEKADDFQRWGQYVEVAALGAAEPTRPWGSGEIPQPPINPNLVEIYPNTPVDPWAGGGEGTFAPGKLMDSLDELFGLAKPTTVVDPKTGTVLIAPRRPVSKVPALLLLGGIGIAAVLLLRKKGA